MCARETADQILRKAFLFVISVILGMARMNLSNWCDGDIDRLNLINSFQGTKDLQLHDGSY